VVVVGLGGGPILLAIAPIGFVVIFVVIFKGASGRRTNITPLAPNLRE
jgi:hypothetical protein